MKSNKFMYKDIDIYKYEMNFKEKYLLEAFKNELIEAFNTPSFDIGRFSDDNEFKFKYHNKMGYFVLYKKNGDFSLVSGFPQMDKESAKNLMLMGKWD